MSYQQPPYGPQHGNYGPPQGAPAYPAYGYGAPPPAPPKEHPSNTTAFVLGLLSVFCLGPILGVPAILLGRKAVRESEASPNQYRPSTLAKVGVALGWVGTFFWSVFILHAVAELALGLAVGFIVVGVAVVGLAATGAFVSLPESWARLSRLLRGSPFFLVPASALAFAGVLELGTHAKRLDREQEVCAKAEGDVRAAVAKNDFAGARSAVSNAKLKCGSGKEAEVAALSNDTDVRESEFVKTATARKASEEAQAAAIKEKDAAESFPAVLKHVGDAIRVANAKMNQAQWGDAGDVLSEARSTLDGVKGTSVASTKDWSDASARVDSVRQKLQPQLDKIAERERKKREAEAAKAAQEARELAAHDAVRGPAPQNSGWDGSVHCVERYIKEHLNDPDSYSHVSSTVPLAVGDTWVVRSTFRAKNAFGATMLRSATFQIQQGQVVGSTDF